MATDLDRWVFFFSISSPNLSFIPPTVSEKIDAGVTNTAFSIWGAKLTDQRNSRNAGRFKSTNQGRGRRLLKFSYLDHPTKSDVTSGLNWASQLVSALGFPRFSRGKLKNRGKNEKNTIHESMKVSFNFIGIFRPKCDLDVQFSELYP